MLTNIKMKEKGNLTSIQKEGKIKQHANFLTNNGQ